jgi:hypothetical protein
MRLPASSLSGAAPEHLPPGEGAAVRSLLPPGKTVLPEDLSRLRAEQPVLAADFRTALIEENPWLQAMRRLGLEFRIDERMVPVEEGETSLNANSNQALASLLPRVLGPRQGVRPTVLGTLAGGNHGLDHALARLARSFPDPARTAERLAEVFGPPALAGAASLLANPNARKVFARLPAALQRSRALRLPACAIEAPAADRLAGLASALGLDPSLADLLAGAREAAGQAGLHTVADFFVLVRARLLERLASLLGAGGAHVPATLEYLIARGTGELARQPLSALVASFRSALASSPFAPSPGAGRIYSRGFRVLHYYDPARLLTRGRKAAGGLVQGWGWLWASHDDGFLGATGAAERELLELPLADLLARGYFLSGRLTYAAVRALNGGAVCNQIFSSPRAGVFASLADPGHPALVLPLTWVNVNGVWQAGEDKTRCPPLDLLVLSRWIERCADPEKTLRRAFDVFCRGVRAARRSGLVLGRTPGSFAVYPG